MLLKPPHTKEVRDDPALLNHEFLPANAENSGFSMPARRMKNFESLTLALEGWFDTELCDLPDGLRLRVERDIFPMTWEQQSAQSRRSLALQSDYQHDPAMEQDRQFWWNFFERQRELKVQIAEWEAKATPTAGDLAQRESRLTELKRKLAQMKNREHRKSAGYYPAPKRPETEGGGSPTSQGVRLEYLAYPKALQQVVGRLNATPEELAAWVWMGPADGGLAAYVNANELDPPPRFHYDLGDGSGDDHDYVSPLMACWFRADEIARFEPAQRYMTGSALIQRWGNQPGLNAVAFIRAKIGESRLLDAHPIYGMTQGSTPEDACCPPLTAGLHRLSDVEAIEEEDFPVEWKSGTQCVGGPRQTGLQPMKHNMVVSDEEARPLAAPPAATADTIVPPAETTATPTEHSPLARPCAVFLSMPSLRADELTIAFVGDQSDAGLGANNMLEISARKTTRRVALASLDLLDRRQGAPNGQAVILLGMATGRRLAHTTSNAAKMKRLRDVLRSHFGLASDPFQPYRNNDGWVPHFAVVDRRGAADERAKREGERRTDSIEELAERGAPLQQAQDSHRPYEAEADNADAWLRTNDRGDPA